MNWCNENILMKRAAQANGNLDDMYDETIVKKKKSRISEEDRLERSIKDRQIANHKRKGYDQFNSQSSRFPKHCIANQTQSFQVMTTPWEPLTKGHCLILPVEDDVQSFVQVIREDILYDYNRTKETVRKAIKSAYEKETVFIKSWKKFTRTQ